MSSEPPAVDDLLTPREREVLEYLRLELTNEQIADELGISANGVKYHVSEIIGKLGVRNRKEAARWPAPRPWWAGALAPAAFVWRKAALVLPKPSALALVVSAGAIAVALGGLGFMAFLLVQGGKTVEERREEAIALLSRDPQPFVDEVLAAMEALDSYQAVTTVPGLPGDLRGEMKTAMQFVAPDTYRNASIGWDGESERRCEGRGPADPERVCYEVFTSITSRSFSETVLTGHTMYSRKCDEDERNCGSWHEYGEKPAIILGIGATRPIIGLPQYFVVALELAEDLHTVAADETPDEPLIHLRGSVDNARAGEESYRRILSSEELSNYASICDENTGGQQACRDVSYDEWVELQRDASRDQAMEISPGSLAIEGIPATIDVWVSPEDFLVRRVSIGWPEAEVIPLTSVTEFSHFNEVEIEAPR